MCFDVVVPATLFSLSLFLSLCLGCLSALDRLEQWFLALKFVIEVTDNPLYNYDFAFLFEFFYISNLLHFVEHLASCGTVAVLAL